ncbi:MAG: hypothetical protein VX246_14830 [Myxococcota bacterium]|nr:hypothetical protein [Myxococcota bacterium]
MADETRGSLKQRRVPKGWRVMKPRVDCRLAVLLLAGFLSACASSGPGFPSHGIGTIIGSLEVVLARPKRSVFDGFFEVNLARIPVTYSFQVGHSARPWTKAPAEVGTQGAPRAFALSLRPGRNVVENLELQLYKGPESFLLGLISPIDGREIKIDVEFPVEEGRITYIGRIRVVLPTNLSFFTTRYKLTVEDQAVEDYAAMASLIENVSLPVHKALATRIR